MNSYQRARPGEDPFGEVGFNPFEDCITCTAQFNQDFCRAEALDAEAYTIFGSEHDLRRFPSARKAILRQVDALMRKRDFVEAKLLLMEKIRTTRVLLEVDKRRGNPRLPVWPPYPRPVSGSDLIRYVELDAESGLIELSSSSSN